MDPLTWDSDEVGRYLRLGMDASDAEGASGTGATAMVLGSTGPFAQLAGRKVLEAGGSAVDAVIATSLAQIALAAGSWVSYAGVFHMVHAGGGHTDSLSAGYATFAEETDPASIPKAPQASGRTALVPGFMAGVAAAHERFGVLSWADLFAPAIYVAEQGFPVGKIRAGQFALREEVLPASFRAVRGDTFRQPDLAATLRAVAAHGADWMYRGAWAREFVDVVRGAGGKATVDDLAGYEPIWAEPLTAGFRGAEVHTLARPDTGGAGLVEALRMAEGVEGDPLGDAKALHDLIKITRKAMRPGSHSDFVLAVDKRGNVAAACHTINTSLWGSTGLFAGGVSIPDSASFQQRVLERLGPGEHVPCPVHPAIVVRDGRPVLASSSIGSGLHCATLQGLHAVLGLGIPLDEVVRRPMFHGPDYLAGSTETTIGERIKGKQVGSVWQDAVARAREAGVPREQIWDAVMAAVPQVVDDRFDPDVVRETEELGQALAVRPLTERTVPRGFWGGIHIGDNELVGGRTPMSGGTVEGI